VAAGIFGQFMYVNPREKLSLFSLAHNQYRFPPIPFDLFAAVGEPCVEQTEEEGGGIPCPPSLFQKLFF